MIKMLLAATSLAIIASPAAAACRDSHGRFTKCPKAASKPIKCRDAKGHFAKCGMPGTHTG